MALSDPLSFLMSCKKLTDRKSIGHTILFNGEEDSIEIRPSYVFLIEAHLEPPCIHDGRELSQLLSAIILSHREEPFTVLFLSYIFFEVEIRHSNSR